MKAIDFIKEKTFTAITTNCDNEYAQMDVIAKEDAQEAVNIAKSEILNDVKNIIYQDSTLDVNVKEYIVHILKDKLDGHSTL